MVLAVAGSTVSPSPPPTVVASSTGSATARRCSRCCASRCSGSATLARKFNRMRRVYREALPVLSSKQKWETVLLPAEQRVVAPDDR